MPLYCELDSMISESDVEQKFLYPFLHCDAPMGLGYSDSEILTKHILKKVEIDKGKKRHYYFPDYVVSLRGLPVMVVEAKAPKEMLEDGYYEARLYALELNSAFTHGFNTCNIVVAANGNEMWIGYADQAAPEIKLSYSEFNIQNINFGKCVDLIGRKELEKDVILLYKRRRGETKYISPVGNLGGKRVQNSELEENAFGRILVFENRGIFDPNTEEEREAIVENAYISSVKREQHMDPMYKEIKRFEQPSSTKLTPIATENPEELVDRLKENVIGNAKEYSLMLIVGNVGSGKTTFTRYFKHIFLERNYSDLASRCEWIFLNMNHAPVSRDEIYSWIKKSIIESVTANHPDMDVDNIETIKKLFRNEISKFEKGLGALIASDVEKYNIELYALLQKFIQDEDAYLTALIKHIKGDFAQIPIVVMDNCDKRHKDEQLLMFEVAQWLRTYFRCIVLLPMRDTTYDEYKSEPPLDTVVRDLVFRIDPPDLLKVLQARLDYLVRITDVNSNTYVLKNGTHVAVKRTELNEYFKSILVAIRKDRWISDIFYRLSNKNIRNGIQVFEDFCKSGHLTPDDIFEMRVLEDDAEIPTYKFENALLRKNRRYYNSNESNFISLFASDFHDDWPDPLVRLDILWWLQCMNKKLGPTKEKGVFPIAELKRNLELLGHSPQIIMREVDYMIRKELIACDNVGEITESDMIKIALPGHLHMQMLKHIAYMGACAEDFLFKNTDVLTRITNRLRQLEDDPYYIQLLNAKDMIDYLMDYRDQYTIDKSFVDAGEYLLEAYDISELFNAINSYIKYGPGLTEAVEKQIKYYPGKLIRCKVISKRDNGLVCLIGDEEVKGFLSTYERQYSLPMEMYCTIEENDIIECSVIEYNFKHKSFQLKFSNRINNTDKV